MILIRLVVTPDSRRDNLIDEGEGRLRLTIKEPAKGGRATMRAREMIAQHLGVSVKNVRVTRGARSRVKMVRVYD